MDVTPLPRKKPFKWRRALLFILLLAVVGGNGVAWRQAWSMTHYAPSGVARETGVGSWLTGLTVPRPENAHTPADVGLTYTTERIPAGVDEQLEAWVVPAPEARGVVLLFTGYIAAKDTLLAPAVAFHDWGYTTVLVDFRGAGR